MVYIYTGVGIQTNHVVILDKQIMASAHTHNHNSLVLMLIIRC